MYTYFDLVVPAHVITATQSAVPGIVDVWKGKSYSDHNAALLVIDEASEHCKIS